MRFATCDRVRFAALEVDVDALGDLAQVRDALLDGLAELQAQHARCALLVRARLVGRGKLHDDLRRPRCAARAARGATRRMQQRGALRVVGPAARTTRDRPSTARPSSARGDLSAELLHLSGTLAADEQARRSFLDDAFADGPGRQLPGELREPDDAETASLLAEAEGLALDQLEGD